jgi:hypothetical protein
MVTAVCGGGAILGTLAGEEVLYAHEPSNAIAPSRTTQHVCQSWTAVSLTTAHKFLANALA